MSAKILQSIVAASFVMLVGCGGAHAGLEGINQLAQADPVRVVDQQSRRVMTEQDVIALANLRHFVETTNPPHHHEVPRQHIEDLVSLLNRHVARNGMHRSFSEAAEFWGELQRDWSDLSSEQRDRARVYASSMVGRRAASQEPSRVAEANSHHHDHGHASCQSCAQRSTHHHRSHDHRHGHSHSSHDHRHAKRSSGQSSRPPASVTAEIGNLPIMQDAIFPP